MPSVPSGRGMLGYFDPDLAEEEYYAVLGVPRTFDEKELKKRYHELCLRWHPDRMKAGASDADRAEAELKFKLINSAYETLSDPAQRNKYDREQSQKQAPFFERPDSAHTGAGSAWARYVEANYIRVSVAGDSERPFRVLCAVLLKESRHFAELCARGSQEAERRHVTLLAHAGRRHLDAVLRWMHGEALDVASPADVQPLLAVASFLGVNELVVGIRKCAGSLVRTSGALADARVINAALLDELAGKVQWAAADAPRLGRLGLQHGAAALVGRAAKELEFGGALEAAGVAQELRGKAHHRVLLDAAVAALTAGVERRAFPSAAELQRALALAKGLGRFAPLTKAVLANAHRTVADSSAALSAGIADAELLCALAGQAEVRPADAARLARALLDLKVGGGHAAFARIAKQVPAGDALSTIELGHARGVAALRDTPRAALTPQQAPAAVPVALRLNDDALLQRACDLIARNFAVDMPVAGVPAAVLARILTSEDLSVASEDDPARFVARIVGERDGQLSDDEARSLARCVRLEHLTTEGVAVMQRLPPAAGVDHSALLTVALSRSLKQQTPCDGLPSTGRDRSKDLLVTCTHQECGGRYALAAGEGRNGRPLWRKRGGDRVLYAIKDGKYIIGTEEHSKEDKGWVHSVERHGGRAPHELGAWLITKDGAWQADPTMTVVAPGGAGCGRPAMP